MELDRRTFLTMTGTGLAALAFGASRPEPYFRDYSLRGLYDVLDRTTVADHQNVASRLIFERMDSLFPKHDHLTRNGRHLVEYGRKVSLTEILQAPSAFVMRKGSKPYGAIIAALPKGKERVWNAADRIVMLRDVRSSRDSETFSTGGLSLGDGTILVEYTRDPGIFLALVLHEAVHAEGYKHILLSERDAMRAELEVLRALPSAETQKYVDLLTQSLATADFLVPLGEEFNEIYPRQTVALLDLSSLGKGTLETYARATDPALKELRTVAQNELFKRENVPQTDKAAEAKQTVHETPRPVASASSGEERIPDPHSDSVITIV